MALVVQKFGGTSVATAERIRAAARRAVRARQAGNQVVVVVSARGDTTDELLVLAREVSERPGPRELDMLLSTGEQVSIALMAMAISDLGAPALSLTGAQVGIVTDSTHGKARIRNISTARIRAALADGSIVVVAGFQGIDDDWNITTLGRGGSDTTAVALAAVLMHDRAGTPPISFPVGCEIFTDVDGVYTTDPRLLPEARKLDVIGYDEMLELASAGANVLHSRSVEFAKKFDVPVMLRSAFSDVDGTWIVPETDWMRSHDVCGVAIVRDEGRVSLTGVPHRPGAAQQIFAALAERHIVVDMVAQTIAADGRATIGLSVPRSDLPATIETAQKLAGDLGVAIDHDDAVSKVSVVGAGMRSRPGVAARVLRALADASIPVAMITTSEIKISVLVHHDDGLRALRAIHEAFRLAEPRLGAGMPAPGPVHPRGWPGPAADDAHAAELTARIQRLAGMEDVTVEDMEITNRQGRIAVAGLPPAIDAAPALFEALACDGVVLGQIVFNRRSDGAGDLAFSVPLVDLERAARLSQNLGRSRHPGVAVQADGDTAVLVVRGVGVRSQAGAVGGFFGSLAERGVNVLAVNTSETALSVVVNRNDGAVVAALAGSAFGAPCRISA